MTMYRYKAVDCHYPEKPPAVVEAINIQTAARQYAEDLWDANHEEETWFVVSLESIDDPKTQGRYIFDIIVERVPHAAIQKTRYVGE